MLLLFFFTDSPSQYPVPSFGASWSIVFFPKFWLRRRFPYGGQKARAMAPSETGVGTQKPTGRHATWYCHAISPLPCCPPLTPPLAPPPTPRSSVFAFYPRSVVRPVRHSGTVVVLVIGRRQNQPGTGILEKNKRKRQQKQTENRSSANLDGLFGAGSSVGIDGKGKRAKFDDIDRSKTIERPLHSGDQLIATSTCTGTVSQLKLEGHGTVWNLSNIMGFP